MGNFLVKQPCDTLRNHEERLKCAFKGNLEIERYLRSNRGNITYDAIAPFMTREKLAQLGQQKIARRTLLSLSRNRLWYGDKFMFWEDILSAGDVLPVEWRAQICQDCFNSGEICEPMERDGSFPDYTARNYDKRKLAGYVVTSQWLVDSPMVRKWYCRLHKPGYESLSYIDQKREVNYPMRDALLQKIKLDFVPEFGLVYGLCGKISNWTLLHDILEYNSCKIFSWLVKNKPKLFLAIKPFQLMIYIVANMRPTFAIAFLECLEHHFPGTISHVDELGNNLLWYSLHNMKIYGGSHPDRLYARTLDDDRKKLIVFLCRNGCRFGARNNIGLSYADICKAKSDGFARFYLSLDDYMSLVFLLLKQEYKLSDNAADSLMRIYDVDWEKCYEENEEPHNVAFRMVKDNNGSLHRIIQEGGYNR